MKRYRFVLKGSERLSIIPEGEQLAIWTLDFSGMLTSVGAVEEAKRFLRTRGEVLKSFRLTDRSGDKLSWTYEVTTEPIELCVEGARPLP